MEDELQTTNNTLDLLRDQINAVVKGQDEVVSFLLTTLLADGHALIEGLPGVAKTLTARLISRLVDARFSRIQMTADLMPSDVLGLSIFNMANSQFEFHPGPVFADIVLVDEINRAPAKTQSALFEVMEERQATIDGKKYNMGDTFTIFATQNPIEQEGTYRLPEAQMDRFLMKVKVGYPAQDAEKEMLLLHREKVGFQRLNDIKPVISLSELAELRAKVKKTWIEDKLVDYIIRLVSTTRSHPHIFVGASPRASIALMQASQAYALLNGRDFVVPDDIKRLAVPVLAHRLTLTAEAEMDGRTVEAIIKVIAEQTCVPQ